MELEKKVDINIYFKPEAPEDKVLEFQKLIFELPEVDTKRSNLMSRDMVLSAFKKKHAGNLTLQEALKIVDENPFGAILNIKAKEIGNYKAVADFIESSEIQARFGNIIEDLNYQQNRKAIEKLNYFVQYIYKFGSIFSMVLILISVIVTFNTIRLIIYTFKDEIYVMRLVGASKFFARGPFVVDGMIQGIVAGIVSFLIT